LRDQEGIGGEASPEERDGNWRNKSEREKSYTVSEDLKPCSVTLGDMQKTQDLPQKNCQNTKGRDTWEKKSTIGKERKSGSRLRILGGKLN